MFEDVVLICLFDLMILSFLVCGVIVGIEDL